MFNSAAGGTAVSTTNDFTSGSVLAGNIAGNPFLESGPARLIVNEVTGGNLSTLAGRIEVYGNPADVVIANPWGITCNGCGFINTNRASLVTGRALWSGNALDGFSVTGSQLTIGSNGLNAPSLSSLDLIAGNVKIDGRVQLDAVGSAAYVIAGPNQVSYNTLTPTAVGRTDAQPSYVIDVGASGGMYANQIYLIANEQGAGVNFGGRAEARSGGLTLDTNGYLHLTGTLKSTGAGSATVVNAGNMQATGSTIDSAGMAVMQSAGFMYVNGGNVTGTDIILGSTGNMVVGTTPLLSTGAVRLNSGAELSINAGNILAGGAVTLSAVGDLTIAPTKTVSDYTVNTAAGTTIGQQTRYGRTSIDAVGSVALQSSAGVVTLDGAQLQAGGSLVVQGTGIAVLARKDITKETTYSGNTTYKPTSENLIQARLRAVGDIALLASGTGLDQGKIFIAGADIQSDAGHVSLLAAKDIDVAHDVTTNSKYERFYEVKRGFFSKRVTDITSTSSNETANATEIGGRSISIGAGGNLNIVGSSLRADGAVGLHADLDMSVLAASEAAFAYESRYVSKSGIFSNGGLSFTIGSKSRTNITSDQETRQASSSVGSLGGDVAATAGGQYLQLSSEILAPLGDVNIAAQNITVQSSNNTRSQLNIIRERQSGITLSASHPLITAAQTVDEMVKVAERTQNARYQAMAVLTSGMTIYNQYKSLTDASKSQTDPKADSAMGGWTFNATLGASRSDYENLTGSSTPVESSINSGRNVSLTATGGSTDRGDINLIGSRIIASENLTLRAERDILLTAAVGKDTEATKRTSSAASIGISVGSNNGGVGANLILAASRSNAWSNGWGTTFWNSELTAGKQLTTDSGRDMSLVGAKSTGETVVSRIGSKGAGNLTIASPQDESFYRAKEQSYGFNASIPIYGGGSAPPSFGLNLSDLKLLAEHESVKQQSAIVAGVGGFNIAVNGHTHLQGAAIASKAANASQNYFQTQTLTHENVDNRDVVSGQSRSLSLTISGQSTLKPDGTRYFPDAKPGFGGSAIGFARIDSNETFTTQSSIAGGVNLTRPDLQASRAAAQKALVRDPLVATRTVKQNQLEMLLWNEPPRCDNCYYDSTPQPVAGGYASAAHSQPATSQTASTSPPPEAGTGNNTWQSWYAAVTALQNEIGNLDNRISALDTKGRFLTAANLSNSPSGLHQPLLHTFDKAKATQELKDGVAVTAAFGKAAYKEVGDYALKQYKTELAKCSDVGNCPEADKWNDGGRYKVAMNAILGAISYGKAGAVSGSAVELAGPAINSVLVNASILPGSAMYDVLTSAVRTAIGVAAGGAQGAATAFNATANNFLLHYKDVNDAKAQKTLRQWANCAPASCANNLVFIETYLRDFLSEQAISQKCNGDAVCVAEGRTARQQFEVTRDKVVEGLSPDAAARRFLEARAVNSGFSFFELTAAISRLQRSEAIAGNAVDQWVRNALGENPPLLASVLGLSILGTDGSGGALKRTSSGDAAKFAGVTETVKPASVLVGTMRDLAYNNVPVELASDKYSWPRTGTVLQSEAHEAAMRQYIMDVEKPVAMFDVKNASGNGFDAAYVIRREDGSYRLVLPEAKSGSINGSNPFSAFGTGARGDAQLNTNLDAVVVKIDASSLSNEAKRQLRDDITNRRFDISLFTGETTNLNASKLDRLREVTGRPVTKVVVLPKR